jgi:hypothetical protein
MDRNKTYLARSKSKSKSKSKARTKSKTKAKNRSKTKSKSKAKTKSLSRSKRQSKSKSSSKERVGPIQSATLYKVGTIKTGNDGNKWIIAETKDGVKRWQIHRKIN